MGSSGSVGSTVSQLRHSAHIMYRNGDETTAGHSYYHALGATQTLNNYRRLRVVICSRTARQRVSHLTQRLCVVRALCHSAAFEHAVVTILNNLLHLTHQQLDTARETQTLLVSLPPLIRLLSSIPHSTIPITTVIDGLTQLFG